MLTIATLLWDPNGDSHHFSRMYDETWVEKLYRGCKRNLRRPFRFVCFVDRTRQFMEPVQQFFITNPTPTYGDCIEPYRLDGPLIVMGLDTVITGPLDGLAQWCERPGPMAVPRDPFFPETVCNGVSLVPPGNTRLWYEFDGRNDMDWVRAQTGLRIIDDEFPGQVVSYKGWVKRRGLGDARIVYFHGEEKPHQIDERFVAEHWI